MQRTTFKINKDNPWMAKVDEPARKVLGQGGPQIMYVAAHVRYPTSDETDIRVAELKKNAEEALHNLRAVINQAGGKIHADGHGMTHLCVELTKKAAQRIVDSHHVKAIREDNQTLGHYRKGKISIAL